MEHSHEALAVAQAAGGRSCGLVSHAQCYLMFLAEHRRAGTTLASGFQAQQIFKTSAFGPNYIALAFRQFPLSSKVRGINLKSSDRFKELATWNQFGQRWHTSRQCHHPAKPKLTTSTHPLQVAFVVAVAVAPPEELR